jgi:hypothetical protein
MEKFNQLSFENICRLIEIGKKKRNSYNTLEELLYSSDYELYEWEFIALGFENPDFNPEVKEYFRIGEPISDGYGAYSNSHNFAEDRPEAGISVVTTDWLHSLKSIFFGTSDDKIAAKGVYKIKGFALPNKGGDDELLIVPLDWAKKTKIRTRDGLEKTVKKAGF